MKGLVEDIKTTVSVFRQMRKSRKYEGNTNGVTTKRLPLVECVGFYNAVEGCALSHAERRIENKAFIAYHNFSAQEQRKFQFTPEDGEFVERAKQWKEKMSQTMSKKECHIAMNYILGWYIHIKNIEHATN